MIKINNYLLFWGWILSYRKFLSTSVNLGKILEIPKSRLFFDRCTILRVLNSWSKKRKSTRNSKKRIPRSEIRGVDIKRFTINPV